MNPDDPHEELISRHRLAAPGPGLQDQVLRAAKSVWRETTEEIPWQIPVLRFAACLIAAALIIAAANGTAPRIVAERQPPSPPRTAEAFPELEGLYGRLHSVEMANREAIPGFLEQRRRLRALLNEGSGEKTKKG